MNEAFLTKLGWRLIQEEDSIWAQVIESKYSVNPIDCSTWRPKTNMSNVWKDILKVVPKLQQGMRKLVRNGVQTSFWKDTWLGSEPLHMQTIRPVPPTDINKSVADY